MKRKNVFRSVIVSFMFILPFAGLAQDNADKIKPQTSFQVRIQPEGPLSFRLLIDNPFRKRLDISIMHSVNGPAVDTMVEKETFSCRYNFESAEDGRYVITISNGKEKFSQEIELNTITTRNIRLR
jgi:hypothetical protein